MPVFSRATNDACAGRCLAFDRFDMKRTDPTYSAGLRRRAGLVVTLAVGLGLPSCTSVQQTLTQAVVAVAWASVMVREVHAPGCSLEQACQEQALEEQAVAERPLPEGGANQRPTTPR